LRPDSHSPHIQARVLASLTMFSKLLKERSGNSSPNGKDSLSAHNTVSLPRRLVCCVLDYLLSLKGWRFTFQVCTYQLYQLSAALLSTPVDHHDQQ